MTKRQPSPEEQYYLDRSKWVEQMFEALEFGHAGFRVLFFIARRSDFEKQGCYWSVSKMARKCRVSTKTVSDATMQAERLGFLKITRMVGENNFYKPVFFWQCDTY